MRSAPPRPGRSGPRKRWSRWSTWRATGSRSATRKARGEAALPRASWPARAPTRRAPGDPAGARRVGAPAGELAGARPPPVKLWPLLAYDAGLAHLEGRFADV